MRGRASLFRFYALMIAHVKGRFKRGMPRSGPGAAYISSSAPVSGVGAAVGGGVGASAAPCIPGLAARG